MMRKYAVFIDATVRVSVRGDGRVDHNLCVGADTSERKPSISGISIP
jgi:hypothetical protein